MAPIIEHADIRRTLLTMQSMTQAARMICVATAAALDVSHRAHERGRARSRPRPARRC